MSDGPRGECVENEVTVTGLGEPFVFYILSQTKDDGIKVRDRLRDMVAKARAEAFEEAAKKFMAVKETEDKLCHHPRMCVVTVTESLLRMAADCRAKAKE